MKNILRFISFFLCVVILAMFAACKKPETKFEDKENLPITINKFIDKYSELSKNFDMDFIDVSIDTVEIKETDDGKEYAFVLLMSFQGKSAELKVGTDKQDNVRWVSVKILESALDVFESSEQIVAYYTIVAMSADTLSEREYKNYSSGIIDAWNSAGDVRIGKIDNLGNIVIYKSNEKELVFNLELFNNSMKETEELQKEAEVEIEEVEVSSQQVTAETAEAEAPVSSTSNTFSEYEACPFEREAMEMLCTRTKWYDNGVFSDFAERSIANAEWQYIGTLVGKIDPNPFNYDGYDVYLVNAHEYQDHIYSIFIVPYSRYVTAPNVYAYDEEKHMMKLVYVAGEILGDGNYSWVYGEYESGAYNDSVIGYYNAEFMDVQITISKADDKYYLTYVTDEATISNIPADHVEERENGKLISFITDDHSQHKGYVEFVYAPQSVIVYSYNALIEGIGGTDGDYSMLEKC